MHLGSRRTIAASPDCHQSAGPRPGRAGRTRLATVLGLCLLLGACGWFGGSDLPEAAARWAGGDGDGDLRGAGQVLVTALAEGTISEAELRPPTGRSLYAGDLKRPPADRDYGVALYGSSDSGVSVGLSLDIIARAMDPPRKRRFTRIVVPASAVDSYRSSWQRWQLILSFSDGARLVLPAPAPGPAG